jgi:short-subunit dehydrogenase
LFKTDYKKKFFHYNFFSFLKIKVLAVDFNRTDIYDIIKQELNKLQEIEILVNNVGVMYDIPEYFTEIQETFNDSYTNVNMVSATKMLEIILPKMVAKRSGIIINISSTVSDQPLPLCATYSASKSFLLMIKQ